MKTPKTPKIPKNMTASKEKISEILDLNAKMQNNIELYINQVHDLQQVVVGQSEVITGMNNKMTELERVLRLRGSRGVGADGADIEEDKDRRSRRVAALYKRIESDPTVMAARKENIKEDRRGLVRVGRIASRMDKGERFPKTAGFINIAVTSHNTNGIGSELSPYKLQDADGHLMENIWQFAKVYSFIPDYEDKKTGWSYSREIHIDKKTQSIKQNYWSWRKKGMEFKEPIRYPVGIAHRQYCKYAVWPQSGKLADAVNMNEGTEFVTYKYVPARVKIYCPVYMEMAKKCKDFDVICQLLDEGYNVQILDVDGPRRPAPTTGVETPFPYNQMPEGKYGENGVGSIEINEANIKALLANVSQPFGHGYALACLLVGHPEWITDFDVSAMNSDSPDVE